MATPIDCFTCEIVSKYVTLSSQYTQDLSSVLVGPVTIVFHSLVGLWIVVHGIRMAATGDAMAFLKELPFVMIAAALLAYTGPTIMADVYEAALNVSGSAAAVAMSSIGEFSLDPGNGSTGMEALVRATELGVREIFIMSRVVASNFTLLDPTPLFYAIAIFLPYFVLVVMFFGQIALCIFRLMTITAVSPFLMLVWAFGWGRGMAISGVKSMLSSIIILFMVSLAVTVAMYGVFALEITSVDSLGNNYRDVDMTHTGLLLAVGLGVFGVIAMSEATALANSIVGTAFSGVGSVGLATVASGGAYLAARSSLGQKMGSLLGDAAGKGASSTGDIVKQGAEKVLERIRKTEGFNDGGSEHY